MLSKKHAKAMRLCPFCNRGLDADSTIETKRGTAHASCVFVQMKCPSCSSAMHKTEAHGGNGQLQPIWECSHCREQLRCCAICEDAASEADAVYCDNCNQRAHFLAIQNGVSLADSFDDLAAIKKGAFR